ncbi:hypothetical protein D3C72_1766760 [compost metagenome]
MAFHRFVHRGPVAPHLQADLTVGRGACGDEEGVRFGAPVAKGVVQQVDQNAAQVFGVKFHLGGTGFKRHQRAALCRVLRLPVIPYLCHCLVQC